MGLSSIADKISTGLSSYTSCLGSSWEGRAGQHLVNLGTNEILPKIEELQTKSAKYEQACGLAGEIDQHQNNINSYQASLSGLDPKDEKHAGMIAHYQGLITNEQKAIEDLKNSIKGILGG